MAIAAVALMVFFYQFMAPFFSAPGQNEKSIRDAIENAKLKNNQTVSVGMLLVNQGEGFASKPFSDLAVDLQIECTSPSYCCDRSVACEKGALWDSSRVLFQSRQEIPFFVRCEQLFNFFACSLFVGSKPAQVSIESLFVSPVVDLSVDSKVPFLVKIKNTGSVRGVSNTVFLRLFVRKDGELVPVSFRELPVGELEAQESQTVSFEVILNQIGDMEAQVEVTGEKAGSDSKTINFKSVGVVQSNCRAITDAPPQTSFDSENDLCKKKFACEECVLAAQCLFAWKNADPNQSFVEGDFLSAWVLSTPVNGHCD